MNITTSKADKALTRVSNNKSPSKGSPFLKRCIEDKFLIMMALIPTIYFLIFAYLPMGGLVMAFQKYSAGRGFFHSPFVGFKWFTEFFNSIYFGRVVGNTLMLSIQELIFGFPLPIIFALLVNELRNKDYKKFVQTVSYLPHFISTVIICGLIFDLFNADMGIVNQFRESMGLDKIAFLTQPEWFRPLYVGSGIWQGVGWGSIIYLAALAGIDTQMYEAAVVDGAGKFKQMIYITLPSLIPVIMTLLILRMGHVMSVGFEKVLLLYSPAVYETGDVISTFVYRRGIIDNQYSFASAVGLFNSFVNLILVVLANKLSKKLTDVGLW